MPKRKPAKRMSRAAPASEERTGPSPERQRSDSPRGRVSGNALASGDAADASDSAKKPGASAKPLTEPITGAERKRQVAAYQARIAAIEGRKLTRKQLADIQWLDKLDRERIIEAWIEAVPKGDYCRLANRQHKLIDDAAENYRLPLNGPTVNLQEVITALHDLIAANAHKLKFSGDRQELEEEKLRQQIVGLERENEKKLIDLLYAKGRAVPKEAVQEALVWLSGRLQQLGKRLESIDDAAREQLSDFLESLALEIESGQLRF